MYIDAVLMVLKRNNAYLEIRIYILEKTINTLEKIDYTIYTACAITGV